MTILMKFHDSVSNKTPSFPTSSLSPLLLLTYCFVAYETVPTYHFLMSRTVGFNYFERRSSVVIYQRTEKCSSTMQWLVVLTLPSCTGCHIKLAPLQLPRNGCGTIHLLFISILSFFPFHLCKSSKFSSSIGVFLFPIYLNYFVFVFCL